MTMLAKRCGVKPDVGVMHGRLAAHSASSTTGTPISAAFCRFGHAPGELLLAVADGMDHPMLATRAPFDLLIANILAGPLIELAPAFAASVAPGASVVLAGLLDTQTDAVAAAYEASGMRLTERGEGEWCVLVLESQS